MKKHIGYIVVCIGLIVLVVAAIAMLKQTFLHKKYSDSPSAIYTNTRFV